MEQGPPAPAVRHPLARLFLGVAWLLLVAIAFQGALRALPGTRSPAGEALSTAVLLAAATVMLWLAVRRGKVLAPSWKRGAEAAA